MQRYIEFIMQEACPSIRFRLKKEILSAIDKIEAEILQSQILEDDLIKKYISLQTPDGWISADFHSQFGAETAVKVLCEKGLSSEYTAVSKLLFQLEQRNETFDQGSLSKVGKILDEQNLGGSQLIRAVVFAYAGVEEKPFVKNQISSSLDVFKFVLGVNSISDVTKEYKNKLVFMPGIKWPSIYHLKLLAFTNSWRNQENTNLLIQSIKRLVELSPIPHINLLWKSQLISAASFCMHNFGVDMTELDAKGWMMWFHRMELLSRIGIVKYIPELKSQVDFLKNALINNSVVFEKKHSHYYFTKWDNYTGLALEKDWKAKERYLCDLIFRSLLILHYSK